MTDLRRKIMLDHLQHGFNIGVEWAFRWPKVTLGIAVVSIAIALVLAGKVSQEFFPLTESKQFNAEVWMPNGTSLAETEEVVRRVEKALLTDKRVVNIASFVGTSSPRFNVTYAPEVPRRHYAQIFVTTTGPHDANDMVKEYLPRLEGFVTDGAVRLRQLSMQEGSPISVRVIGEDLNDQKRVAEQVKEILTKAKGTNFVRPDYEEDYVGVRLAIKEDVASRLGITNEAITQTLGAGLKGFAVSQLWEGDKPVDVYLRLDPTDRDNITDIENLHLQHNVWHKGVAQGSRDVRALVAYGSYRAPEWSSDSQRAVGSANGRQSFGRFEICAA